MCNSATIFLTRPNCSPTAVHNLLWARTTTKLLTENIALKVTSFHRDDFSAIDAISPIASNIYSRSVAIRFKIIASRKYAWFI